MRPDSKNAYQDLQVLPRLDDIKLSGPRVLIVIRPDGRIPPSELSAFFEFQQEKNNLLVLTGQDSHLADAVEDRLRELYAIEQINKRLKPGDTLYEEARDRLHEAQAPIAITVSDGIQFDNGFEGKAFASLTGMQLRPGDVVQED